MISHQYQCIYVHSRKAAGSSINAAFGASGADKHAYSDGPGGAGYQQYPGKPWETRPLHYFVFSSVRNPYDRLVSAWLFLYGRRRRFIDVLRKPPQNGKDWRHFTRPQAAILFLDGRPIYHDLIRFESLQTDFDRVCDTLGKPRMALPHVNATRYRAGYREFYDAEARKLADRLVRDDLDAFGYTF